MQKKLNLKIISALFIIIVIFSSGCVERKLTIRSSPSNARLYLDGNYLGRTPKTLPFVHYGTREIIVAKKGYKTKRVFQPIDAPFYEYFPLDFFSEVLFPFTIEDHHLFHYSLQKEKEKAKEELLKDAKKMKKELDNLTE